MKKLISFICCCVLIMAVSFTAFADEYGCEHDHTNYDEVFSEYQDYYLDCFLENEYVMPCCNHQISQDEKYAFINLGLLEQLPYALPSDILCPFCHESIGQTFYILTSEQLQYRHSVSCLDCGATAMFEPFTSPYDYDWSGGCSDGHDFVGGVCSVCGAVDPYYDPYEDPELPV